MVNFSVFISFGMVEFYVMFGFWECIFFDVMVCFRGFVLIEDDDVEFELVVENWVMDYVGWYLYIIGFVDLGVSYFYGINCEFWLVFVVCFFGLVFVFNYDCIY